ncbi:hypothetical protein J7M07_03775 [bacterium]|nr:hypothetical protein [bacterium]
MALGRVKAELNTNSEMKVDIIFDMVYFDFTKCLCKSPVYIVWHGGAERGCGGENSPAPVYQLNPGGC